jgi:hypothetical protein
VKILVSFILGLFILNCNAIAQNKYILVFQQQLKKMFPSMPDPDVEALAWGGLEKDAATLYNDLPQYKKDRISIANNSYRQGTTGNKCTP